MIVQTKGIVLSSIRYKETSIIVRIYTSEFGLRSYVVNGVKSIKSRGKLALYQPLNLLDLVVYENRTKDIQRISEAKVLHPFRSIPFEMVKTAMALFMAELLSKTLYYAEEQDELKFQFIEQSLIHFDEADENYQNFHLQFMLRFATLLGFRPENIREMNRQVSYVVSFTLSEDELELFELLNTNDLNASVKVPKQIKNKFLDILVAYYQLHNDQLGKLKSLPVLRSIFD